MMRALLALVALVSIIACGEGAGSGSDKTAADTTAKVDNSIDSLGNQLLTFVTTTDKDFCNLDSIVSQDCTTGFVFLTKNNKAVYQFFCRDDVNANREYLLGSFTKQGQDISITWEKKYVYHAGCKDCPEKDKKAGDANAGKETPYTGSLLIKKISCPKLLQYAFSGKVEDRELQFVASGATNSQMYRFKYEFVKLERYKDLWH